MSNRLFSTLARNLPFVRIIAKADEDASAMHEALLGDSALIRLVRELRELELDLADEPATCR